MNTKCLKYYIILFLTVLSHTFVSVSSFANTDKPVKRVLHIDSYHTGYVWSDGIAKGIHDELRKSGLNVEISTEHLDSRRFAHKNHIELFGQSLKKKFEDYKFDVVIASDNPAFDFVVNNRDSLFKNTAIVFCGYNYFRHDVIKDIKNITGINEEVDVLSNVEMALKVHPKTKVLVFVISYR